jgi:hypothetical protein
MTTEQGTPENLEEMKEFLLHAYGPALTDGYRDIAVHAMTRAWLIATMLVQDEALVHGEYSDEGKVLRNLAKRMAGGH